MLAFSALFGSIVLISMVVFQAVAGYRRRFVERTEERVESLYMGARPERFWLLALLGAAGGALLMALVSRFSPVPVAAGTIAGFAAPSLYLGYMERRRRKRFDAQLLEAIPLMAGAMKAGMSLLQAVERITRDMDAPIRQEFAHALQENRVGKPLMQALHDMKDRMRSDDLTITVNAIAIAQQTGGVLSELLLKIAETLRTRNRIRAKINSMSAQGRLQGIILIFVPWVMGLALLLLDPGLMRPMLTTTIGQVTLVGIAILEFFGWVVIRRLIAIDV